MTVPQVLVPEMCPRCAPGVPQVVVPEMCPRCARGVPEVCPRWLCPRCAPGVLCARGVPEMCPRCARDCAPGVPQVCPRCASADYRVAKLFIWCFFSINFQIHHFISKKIPRMTYTCPDKRPSVNTIRDTETPDDSKLAIAITSGPIPKNLKSHKSPTHASKRS